MDRMDLDGLHREAGKRARSINPAISDLRLAVDAAAEMQVSCNPAAHVAQDSQKLLLPLTGCGAPLMQAAQSALSLSALLESLSCAFPLGSGS